jgi:F0F1-type ATP synthase membrane subunit b/b'
MKPVNPAAKLAAAETELACLKITLAQVKEDHEELRQKRDDWRREAEICAERLIAAKLREADEPNVAPPERRPWWRRLAG